MSGSKTEDLARDALALPLSERAELARRLLSSLDEADETDEDTAEDFALRTAVARSHALDAGTATAYLAAEVLQRLRARLRR